MVDIVLPQGEFILSAVERWEQSRKIKEIFLNTHQTLVFSIIVGYIYSESIYMDSY